MRKLLVVVDFQNDFVDGSLGFPDAVKLEGKICEKITQYKNDGQKVVFTLDTHDALYEMTQEGRNLPVIHCIKGTKGHDLYGRVLQLSEGCQMFEKGTFGSDRLFFYMRENEFDSIELVGLVSNMCVLTNAILAKTALPEALITVDAACTTSFDPQINQKTLDILESIQITVTNR
jgi:nicotinamidase/pyrazinamidase